MTNETKLNVFVDRIQLQELEKEFPNQTNYINSEIKKLCEYYSKHPFKEHGELARERKIFLQKIKRSITFINPDVEEKPPVTEVQKREDFTLIWDKELKDYHEEEKEWVVDRLIPSCSVGVLAGKQATMKTFTALTAAYAVATGSDFLGRYPTKQGKVLYLDKENGASIMKQRTSMIKQGMGVEDVDVGFICFSNLKLDSTDGLETIRKLIAEHKPTLLIIDTYRRVVSYEENDATSVSEFFVDYLRPLVEKSRPLTILLIHHDKKGQNQDDVESMRGSSDLGNYADFVLKNERKSKKKLILKQAKMRNAPEVKPLFIEIDTDEETYIKFNSTGEFVTQTLDQKAGEVLMLWIVKNKLKEFKTKDAKEVAFNAGIKRTNFQNGLNMLKERCVIENTNRGWYKVVADNAKLIV